MAKLLSVLWPTLLLVGGTSIIIGYLTLCGVRWLIIRTANFRHFRLTIILVVNRLSALAGLAYDAAVQFVAFSVTMRLVGKFMPSVVPAGMTFQSLVHQAGVYPRIALLLPVLPLFFCTLWLDLYAVSGYLIKASRRFDIGFQSFNRKFDIEKKPLQAIGLVAGALVATAYWSFALTMRIFYA